MLLFDGMGKGGLCKYVPSKEKLQYHGNQIL
jgi:hypothetical protein